MGDLKSLSLNAFLEKHKADQYRLSDFLGRLYAVCKSDRERRVLSECEPLLRLHFDQHMLDEGLKILIDQMRLGAR